MYKFLMHVLTDKPQPSVVDNGQNLIVDNQNSNNSG